MASRDEGSTCDFCGQGTVERHEEEMAFHQWTDRGYAFCRVRIPMGVCTHCGAKSWSEDTEAIIEAAVQQAYKQLS